MPYELNGVTLNGWVYSKTNLRKTEPGISTHHLVHATPTRGQNLLFSFKNSHGHSSQFRMEWSKINSSFLTFFLSIRKKIPQLQCRKCASKSYACENAKVFSEVYTCPAFLLSLDFHKDVSGFGFFSSGKLSFPFKLQQWNVKGKLRCHLEA